MEVSFSISEGIEFDERHEALITQVLVQGLSDEGIHAEEVSVVITSDEGIKRLNHRHRGLDKPTDVLSFPLYDGDIPPNAQCLGDIVISLPRAQAQADEFGHSQSRELAFLAAHGLFHLLGYDHQDQSSEQIMITKQEALLAKLGLPR